MHDTRGRIAWRGSREYTPNEASLVIRFLTDCQPGDFVETADLARLTIGPEKGRTVRAIVGDYDGSAFVVQPVDGGYRIPRFFEDIEPGTVRLERQANRLLERASRRRRAATHYSRRQHVLPGFGVALVPATDPA